MVEQLLELRRCQQAFAYLQVCLAADVSGIEAVEGIGKRQVVLNRGPQDFDGPSRIVLMGSNRATP